MKNTKKLILVSLITIFTIAVVYNFKKIFVLSMIFFGSFLFPEASQSLKHYCFGDGSDLIVNSDYIKNSPVVKKHLAKMKVGQKKKVGFHQWEDFRLSFAIESFYN